MSPKQVFEKLKRKPYPTDLCVDIHTYCNGRCFFCPYQRLANRGKIPWGKMKWSLFEKIVLEYAELINEYNFVGQIGFCLMGEPFVEKEIVKYTKFIIEHGIEHAFTTNASLMNKEVIDSLIDIGYQGAFKISCHGIRPATVKKLMGLDVKQILNNIDYLLERYPAEKIGIRAYPFGWEKGEKKEVKAYWKQKSVSLAGGVPASRGGLIEEIAQPPLKSMRGCTENRPLKHMVISYNGDVLLCCHDMGRREIVDNMERHTLKEIWNSPQFANYLKCLYLGEPSSDEFICRHCELAGTLFNSNKLLKIPRKIYRHYKKKHFEHLDLDDLKVDK